MKRFKKLIGISKRLIDLPDARHKHFSFLMLRNKIISFGYNLSFTTHPISHKYNYRFSSLHSELKCILEFPYPNRMLKNYTLVNVRIMANGDIGYSKPCKHCQKLLKDFGIHKIYYSRFDGSFGKL